MESFIITLLENIKRKAFTSEQYEGTISQWLSKGWLTEEEAAEARRLLND